MNPYKAEIERLRDALRFAYFAQRAIYSNEMRAKFVQQYGQHTGETIGDTIASALETPTPDTTRIDAVLRAAVTITNWIGWDEDPNSGAAGACFISEFDDPEKTEALSEFYQAVQALTE